MIVNPQDERRMCMRARLIAAVTAVAFTLGAWLSVPVLAQKQDDKKPAAPKLDKQQMQEVQAVVKYVEDVTAGKGSAPDATLTWRPYFVKSQGDTVYVPFTFTLDAGALTSRSVAMYYRVVNKTDAAPVAEDGKKKDDKDNASVQFPFEDVSFIDLPPAQGGKIRVSRAFAVPSGDYHVYLVLRERPEKDQKTAPKLALLNESVSVPDMASELTTSSVILADKIDVQTAALSREEQLRQPFTFGGTVIVPASANTIPKTGELSIVFFVYNAGVDSGNKPNVGVEYSFMRKSDEGEKFFNKTNPQEFNAQTLPPQFDLAQGHQLVAGQSVPLASFEPGDYRLEIKITDKTSGKALTRDVPFTVTAS
jgi:hypothetical protein